jgi:hypothetical protein
VAPHKNELVLFSPQRFQVDVPNGPVLMESRTTAPGDKVRVRAQHAAVAVATAAAAVFA